MPDTRPATLPAESEHTRYQPCSFFRRMGAIVYDAILLFCTIFIAWLPVPLIPETLPLWLTVGFKWVYLLALGFLYFAWSWNRGGQTIGMKAWKITVVPFGNVEEHPQEVGIPWSMAAVRFIAAMGSWMILGAGFLLSLFRQDKMALHDMLSKTQLIHFKKTK